MSTKRRPPYHPSPLVLLAPLVALALAACTGAKTPAPPPPSPSPPPPTATPVPADPELGRFYRRNGQYQEAIAVYQAVVARAEEPVRQQARLSLALTYMDSERPEEALAELDAYLEPDPPPPGAFQAHFLRARALTALDRLSEALDEYALYADGGGPAAPYARLARARLLALLGRPAEAAPEAQATLETDLPDPVHAQALLLAAQSLEQAGDFSAARQSYERLFQESDSSADRALARWRQADLARRTGDPSWARAAQELLADYPSTASALDALEALQETGGPIDGYWAGVVLYRHFRDEEAVAALEANLKLRAPSHPAESFYYLAVAQERLGDAGAALDAYKQSLEKDPDGPLADDAAWWRARLLETKTGLEEARTSYTEFVLRYAGSPWAPDARFRRGLLSYKQGRFDEAVEVWSANLAPSQTAEDKGRTLLWLAKAEAKLGDAAASQAYLRQLAALPDAGYFALRAAALLGEQPAEDLSVDIIIPPPDWAAADAWAATLDPWAAAPTDPTSDRRWLQAHDLLALGLYDEAQANFESLLSAYGSSPARLYRLARAFDAEGQAHLAARAAALLLDRLSPAAAEAAPLHVWRLAYPAAFASLVETASRREGVPVELLLALIRQESFFDPRAGSSAGALGLTQVVPSTGQAIAEDLGVEDEFDQEDLLRPSVSVRFGAHYLKRQLDEFDGAVPEALAAYNGGPGNARRWSRDAASDPDLFLEEIDLPETESYLRLVSENLARYRQLYASPDRIGDTDGARQTR